jgi:hypothetical protein
MVHHRRAACRSCGSSGLERFLALGPTPLANSFLASPDEFAAERSYPLDVYFCEGCTLVQLLDVIDPEALFRDYIYVTGTSETIAGHNREHARSVVELLELGGDDLVVEAASNDGSLLTCYQRFGVRTLGVEPAKNIAAMARERGVETLCEFFGAATAAEVRRRHGPARAVLGNNVLAHVDDTPDFLRGCAELIRDDGLVIVEVPYLEELLDRLEYDTVYHEHLCYFSVTALRNLFESVGLRIARVDRVPVHGGSIRVYAGKASVPAAAAGDVDALLRAEERAGLTDLARYRQLARDVETNRRDLVELLRSLEREGKTVAGYGAPAKGNTLLNYCGIDTSLLPYTVDRAPLKVGKFTPGMHIPVLPVETLVERRPDYVLILAWNFAEEIMRQQDEYLRGGGKFIIPVPEPRIVEGS